MKNVKKSATEHMQSKLSSNKHDVNLQKRSTLYFQIGLILCLLGAYFALEANFESESNIIQKVVDNDSDKDVFVIPNTFTVEKKIAKNEPKSKNEPKVLVDPKLVDDQSNIDESSEIVNQLTKEIPDDANVKFDDKELNIEKPDEMPVVPVSFVEQVPVYPGCEKFTKNKDLIKCMSDKLGNLVQKKFNTDIASDEGLSGKQRIYVQFKIRKNGTIALVNTRASHKSLENEAARLVDKIPHMVPGQQNGKQVEVLYTLPILFNVQN